MSDKITEYHHRLVRYQVVDGIYETGDRWRFGEYYLTREHAMKVAEKHLKQSTAPKTELFIVKHTEEVTDYLVGYSSEVKQEDK